MAKLPAPEGLYVGSETGADRSLFLRWIWNQGNTDHFEVKWEYRTGNTITDVIKKKSVTTKVWFTGSESSSNADIRIATYSYPTNAKEVRVQIKAVAKENGDKGPYWTSGYSKWMYFTPKDAEIKADKIKSTPNSVEITKEKNTNNTLHARWKWKYKFTEFFKVTWYYTDGTQIDAGNNKTKSLWYLGASEEVLYDPDGPPLDLYSSTYSCPDSAVKVQFRVQPISQIKSETETVVTYYWKADYSSKDYVVPVYSAPAAKNKLKNTRIIYQNGTSRGLIATWEFNQGSVDHYEYRWEYTTGQQHDVYDDKQKKYVKQDIYFDGESGSTTKLLSTYTLPDEAVQARFVVQPIAKNNTTGQPIWKTDNSGYVYSPRTNKQLKDTVSDFTIVPEQGGEASYVARWKWSKEYTDHYEVSWFYRTGTKDASGKNELKYSGTTESTKNLYSTYSPPANATVVLCAVLPIARASRWKATSKEVFYKVTAALDNISSKKKVTDLQIFQQEGNPRTVFAQWTWNSEGFTSTIDHYEVDWRYALPTTVSNKNIWIIESLRTTSSVEAINNDVYNVPDKAVAANVRVRPISKKHKVNGIDTSYWVADWSERVVIDMVSAEEAATDPPVPQTPSVLMEGLNLIAEVNIYDEGADIIEFNVVKDDSSDFGTVPAKIIFNHAEVRIPVDIGGEYKVRARSLRANGDVDASIANATRGEWSEYSENVGTIPATPLQILSHRVESTTVVYLQWSEVSNITGYKIEYATNPDFFDASGDVKSISTGPGPGYYVTGLDSGQNYFFRVRAVNNNGESGWTPIYSLILGTQPQAPTTWSDTTRGIIGEELYLYWTHNSEDKSSQKAAQVELTIGRDVTIVNPTELTDGSTPSFYIFNTLMTINQVLVDDSQDDIVDQDSDTLLASSIIPYSERTSVSWRVRTKGIAEEWSEWSTQRTIMLYSEPTIALYVGDDSTYNNRVNEVRHYPLYIHAEAFPEIQKAIGYTVSIIATEPYETVDRVGDIVSIRDQQTVFEKYYPATDGNVLDVSLLANDVNLDNDITYTLDVNVVMDSGLTGVSSWTFAARWDDVDLTPDAEVTINKETLCAYIRPYCMTENGDYILNVLLSIYRVEYDGRFVLIADGVANGETTIVDPHPALNYARYRVVATSIDTGEMGFRDIPGAFVGETSIVIQWDEAWRSFETYDGTIEGEFATSVYSGSMVKLPYNVEVSDSTDLDVALSEYIGRSHPVSYYGTQLGVKGSWNAVIPRDDIQTVYALRRLAVYRGDVYVREPSGVGYWANINVSFSKRYSEMTIPVSLNVTRVEGGI